MHALDSNRLWALWREQMNIMIWLEFEFWLEFGLTWRVISVHSIVEAETRAKISEHAFGSLVTQSVW